MVECRKWDKFWASGLSLTDTVESDLRNWPGKNMLGHCLERVRTHLAEDCENKDEDKCSVKEQT